MKGRSILEYVIKKSQYVIQRIRLIPIFAIARRDGYCKKA